MATPLPHLAHSMSQEALLAIFLPAMRQRFKQEVNRLTKEGMVELLGNTPDKDDLVFLMSYLYAWHWLGHNVHENYRARVLESFRGGRFDFLMNLLMAKSATDFVQGYIAHWQTTKSGPVQREELLRLLATHDHDPHRLATYILEKWQSFGLFGKTYLIEFKEVGRDERQRYDGMLGEEDRARLALVDAIAESVPSNTVQRHNKLGIIPAMGCPQTCRHCMFTWRPPKPKQDQSDVIFDLVDAHTESVLFTGGDLTKQLDYFYAAIRKMQHIRHFAILLNGDFADTPEITRDVLRNMAEAIKSRPAAWPVARVLLQISFDEFHQEVYVDKKGNLAERIPVAKIANIVEAYPRYAQQIQLALLHKQTNLNFSMDVLHKGVFARLTQTLALRGHQVQILATGASPRHKRNPLAGEVLAPVLKDATFVLTQYPDAPILLTSSTIDGYGRGALLDEWETIKETDLLHEVLTNGPPPGEAFDIDLMFWFNGWVTLFNAVHICLGDVYEDGVATIFARQRKDPLSHALHRFDRRLLELYAEVCSDLEEKIRSATGPHHLFHSLTESPHVRLHMTRRLLDQSSYLRS